MATEEIKKNIILLGDGAVGKTSLIRRYVLDQFDERYVTTIGSKVTKKEVEIMSGTANVRMVMLIWDIIGQKDYELTQTLSMKNIDGAILVSDMTRRETLVNLKDYWIPKILSARGQIPVVFLANKCDMVEERQFSMAQLEDVAILTGGINEDRVSSFCFETSARAGTNIDTAFHRLAGAMLEKASMDKKDILMQDLIKNSEAKSLGNVVDFIIADFADQYGGIEVATPIVKQQMMLASLDPRNPTVSSVAKFIDLMAGVEKTFKPESDVAANKQQRLQKLKKF